MTIRGWYGYSILEPESQARRMFLFLTKLPIWLTLGYAILRYNFDQNWVKISGVLKFDLKMMVWTIIAIFLHILAFLLNGVLPNNFDFISNITLYLILFETQNAIVEEFLFRGGIQTFFEKYTGKFLGNLIQAVLFSMIHWCWWVFDGQFSWGSANYIFLLGFFWGFIRNRSNSLWPTIFAHFVHNVILVL